MNSELVKNGKSLQWKIQLENRSNASRRLLRLVNLWRDLERGRSRYDDDESDDDFVPTKGASKTKPTTAEMSEWKPRYLNKLTIYFSCYNDEEMVGNGEVISKIAVLTVCNDEHDATRRQGDVHARERRASGHQSCAEMTPCCRSTVITMTSSILIRVHTCSCCWLPLTHQFCFF